MYVLRVDEESRCYERCHGTSEDTSNKEELVICELFIGLGHSLSVRQRGFRKAR